MPSPKGASEFKALTASLKRCPDSNWSFPQTACVPMGSALCMDPSFHVFFYRIVTKCEWFKLETQSSGTLSLAAARSGENSSGSLSVLSGRTGARGAQDCRRALRIRGRAHISADWTDWLLDRTYLRHAANSVGARIPGDRRLSRAV